MIGSMNHAVFRMLTRFQADWHIQNVVIFLPQTQLIKSCKFFLGLVTINYSLSIIGDNRLPVISADIVELITDVMITQAPTLRVTGTDRPIENLRGLFFRLSAEQVETALWNLRKYASSDITDKKAYMRTLLYDAMLTMNTGIYHATKK